MAAAIIAAKEYDMKRVTQTILGAEKGDCFRACLASILERDDVPNCHGEQNVNWIFQYDKYLKRFNLHLFWCQVGAAPAPKGYSILSVKSVMLENAYHAVVLYQNRAGVAKVIWNPNPIDPRGCEIPDEDWRLYYVLVSLNPAKLVYNSREGE